MDHQQDGRNRLANAEKSRTLAQQRHAEQIAEIAGKQAQLKQEAQQRREQRENKPKKR